MLTKQFAFKKQAFTSQWRARNFYWRHSKSRMPVYIQRNIWFNKTFLKCIGEAENMSLKNKALLGGWISMTAKYSDAR